MWRRTAGPEADRAAARVARIVTLAAALLFLVVVTRWQPWNLFTRGGYSTDFYDEQARSFLRGRLAVRPEVATIEGFVVDGRTYLYYGPFLALVRLPFALFGEVFTARLVRISMVAAFVTLCTATFHLGRIALAWCSAQRPDRDETHDHFRLGALVAAVAASPALFLTGWVSVYHETELWAAAFAVWSAVGALRFADAPTRRHAIVTAAAVVAATLTRATVGIGMAVGVCVVMLLARRAAPRPAIAVVTACVAGIGAHIALNAARFGTLLSLPADQQVLTLQNPDRAAWFAGNDGSFFGLRFLPTTIVHYLRPDALRLERLVPFVRFGPPASELSSYPVESNTPASSLTVTATLLLIGAIVGLVVIVRNRAWRWLALVGGGALASAPSFAIGFIANRYLVDTLPMLIVAAAVGAAAVSVPSVSRARRLLSAGVVLLIAIGFWTNVALATWTQNIKEPGFTSWRYQVDDLVFGDPAPGLVDAFPGAPVPRDGVVGLDPDCAGVYVAEQGRWVVLERRAGDREVVGILRLGGDRDGDETVVATGPGWRLVATRTGSATAVLVWLQLDGADTVDETLDSRPVTISDDAVTVRIVIDPVIPELNVEIDGQQALYGFTVPDGPIEVTSAVEIDAEAGSETLCRQLQARR